MPIRKNTRQIAATDWVANDLYPSEGWLNQWHQTRRGDIPGAFCPSPDADLNRLNPGVRGIFYFATVVGKSGFRFDGMLTEVAREITKQNMTLT